jgi:hypothetical protein
LPRLPFSASVPARQKQNPSGFPFAQVEDINIFIGYEIYLDVSRAKSSPTVICIACSVVRYSKKKEGKDNVEKNIK